jgi:hypothetical protein
MVAIDPDAAHVRRLVVNLLLARVDPQDDPGTTLDQIRDEGIDTALPVLADVLDLAAASLVRLHGQDEAKRTLNRLAIADLEEEVSPPNL